MTGAALFAVARSAGVGRRQIGLAPDRVPAGLRLGLGVSAVIVGVVGVLGVLEVSRGSFEDDRFVGLTGAELAWELAVRIPFVTALFEEFAFRGVLLALMLAAFPVARAILLSSALFGLWHVLPNLSHDDGDIGATVVAVIATTAAGAFACWLQRRSGSLVAPTLVHAINNASAFTVGWYVTNHVA